MISKYNQFIIEGREIGKQTKSVSAFTEDEKDLFEDLLQEYIDKYDMMEMPLDPDYEDTYHFFDRSNNRIQYLVQRLRNIGIDIESNSDISLDELFSDIRNSFVPRVKRYGYHVFHCSMEKEMNKNVISITIMKND